MINPLDSVSPNVHRVTGPIIVFLINNIASHFPEWGVNELSWHHLFKSVNTALRDVTALSALSPVQKKVVSSAYMNMGPEDTELGWSFVCSTNCVGPSIDPCGI